jgi:hypothetical protein
MAAGCPCRLETTRPIRITPLPAAVLYCTPQEMNTLENKRWTPLKTRVLWKGSGGSSVAELHQLVLSVHGQFMLFYWHREAAHEDFKTMRWKHQAKNTRQSFMASTPNKTNTCSIACADRICFHSASCRAIKLCGGSGFIDAHPAGVIWKWGMVGTTNTSKLHIICHVCISFTLCSVPGILPV